jgi:hypothetical protein
VAGLLQWESTILGTTRRNQLGDEMRLTNRGYRLLSITVALAILALMGIAGKIEGGM